MSWLLVSRLVTLGVLAVLPFVLFQPGRESTPLLVSALSIGGGVVFGVIRYVPSTWERRYRLVLSLATLSGLLWFMMWGLHQWARSSQYVQLFAAVWLVGVSLLTEFRFYTWSDPPQAPIATVADVLRREEEWLHARRDRNQQPRDGDRVGLCLSGGGLRSAAVSLGFLRELWQLGLFGVFDYLSTVSGGGWAGAAVQCLYARSDAPGEEDWDGLCVSFRARRGYLARAVLLRGLLTMLGGALIVVISAGLLLWVAVAFAYWIEVLDSFKDVGRSVTSRLHLPVFLVSALSGAERAPMLLSRSLQGILPAIASVVLIVTLLFWAVYCLARLAGRMTLALAAGSLGVVLTRQCAALLAILFIVQGRDLITLTTAVAAAGIVLTIANWPRPFWMRAVLSLGIVASAWVIDAIVLETRQFTRITEAWHCLVAQALALEWRLAGVPGTVACVAGSAPSWHPVREALLPDILRFFDVGIAAGIVFLLLGLSIHRSRTAALRWWSEAIANAFLKPLDKELAESPLSAMQSYASRGAPMPILNAAVNVPGSTRARRAVSRFEMTPYCTGGPLSGWAPAAGYDGTLSFAKCVGLSAAAVNTQGGAAIPRFLSWVLLLTNFRLGIWLPNPRYHGATPPWWHRRFVFEEMFQEVARTNTEESAHILVSDGGHDDNTGIAALCARSCSLIVAVDAAADPAYAYTDLRETLQDLTSLGWTVLEHTTPRTSRSESIPGGGRLLLRGPDQNPVRIIHLKAGVTEEALRLMTPQARQYAGTHRAFPQESTADQWFSEAQFDAYYAVGRSLARELARTGPLKG